MARSNDFLIEQKTKLNYDTQLEDEEEVSAAAAAAAATAATGAASFFSFLLSFAPGAAAAPPGVAAASFSFLLSFASVAVEFVAPDDASALLLFSFGGFFSAFICILY